MNAHINRLKAIEEWPNKPEVIKELFDYKRIVQPNIVIHCKTEEQANELLNWADSKGFRWNSGNELSSIKNCYTHFRNKTCYDIFNGYYCDIDYYIKEQKNYHILKFKDVKIK